MLFASGLEGEGIVEKVDADVADVKAGDRVAFCNTLGCYAEFTLVAAQQIVLLDSTLGHIVMAC